MKLEQMIGKRIAKLRAQCGLSPTDLGGQLAMFLAKPWSRQAVWAAETGQRVFTAAELVALAALLRTTVGELLEPPECGVEMPSGTTIGRELYRQEKWRSGGNPIASDGLEAKLAQLRTGERKHVADLITLLQQREYPA